MKTEKLSRHEFFSILSLFFLGGVSTVGGANESGKSTWISLVIGAGVGAVLVCVYLKAVRGNDTIFGIFKGAFGSKIGIAASVICGTTALYCAMISVAIFLHFTSELSFLNTPKLIFAAVLAFTLFYILRGGIASFGRFSAMLLPVMVFFIAISVGVAVNICDFSEIVVAVQSTRELFEGSFSAAIVPYAESFFAISALGICVKSGKERAQASFGALILGAAAIVIIFLKNMSALGFEALGAFYFPSYNVSSMVSLGSFFQRFEIFTAMNFLIGTVCKAAVFLFFAAKIIEPIFGKIKAEKRREKTKICADAALCIIACVVGGAGFGSIMQLFTHLQYYKYILTVPVVIIPILIVILRRLKR